MYTLGRVSAARSPIKFPETPPRSDSANGVFRGSATPPLPPIARNNTRVPESQMFDRQGKPMSPLAINFSWR